MAESRTHIVISAETQKAIRAIEGVQKTIRRTTLAAIGATAALTAFVAKTTKGISNIYNLSRETNTSVETLQRLGYVASQTNSSVDTLQGTISSLTDRIGEAAMYGDDTFNLLGINARDTNGNIKSATAVLDEVREKMLQINDVSVRRNMLSRLGIDSSMYQMLTLNNREFQKLINEANQFGVTSEAEAKRANSFQKELSKMQYQFSRITTELGLAFLPTISKTFSTFSDFLKRNQRTIIEFGKIVANAFGTVIGVIDRVFKAMERTFGSGGAATIVAVGIGAMILPIGKIIPVIKGLATVFGALRLSMLPITLALAGILLLIEDFYVYKTGGKSVIGKLIEMFEKLDEMTGGLFSGLAKALRIAFAPILATLEIAMDLYQKLNEKGFFSISKQTPEDVYMTSKEGTTAPSPIIGFDGEAIPIPVNQLAGYNDPLLNPGASSSQIINSNNAITINIEGTGAVEIGKQVDKTIQPYFAPTPQLYGNSK